MALWIKSVQPSWFSFVSARADFDEVNLWNPSHNRSFEGAEVGDIVVFRIEGRKGQIFGYGQFFASAIYWASDAWDIFGERNGVGSLDLLNTAIRARRGASSTGTPLAIACHDIVHPVYFHNGLRARIPPEVLARLGPGPIEEDGEDGKLLLRFIGETEAQARQFAEVSIVQVPSDRRPVYPGRSGFRLSVTEAYGRTCAITGETVLPAPDAVHIIAREYGGGYGVRNGLLLKRDLHGIYDAGYLSIDDQHRVMISVWLPQAFPNSATYLALNNATLLLPRNLDHHPDPTALAWHREMRFYKGGQFTPRA